MFVLRICTKRAWRTPALTLRTASTVEHRRKVYLILFWDSVVGIESHTGTYHGYAVVIGSKVIGAELEPLK